MANHLHQLVILMEAGSYAISNQLFQTEVWERSPQRLVIFGDLLPK